MKSINLNRGAVLSIRLLISTPQSSLGLLLLTTTYSPLLWVTDTFLAFKDSYLEFLNYMLDIGKAQFLRVWLLFFQEGVLNFFYGRNN